jgi:protein TonB
MERGGFLETRKTNPVTLGLIVAAHGVVLTALALAPPETFKPIRYLPTTLYPVDEPAPPPPAPLPTPHLKQMPPVAPPMAIDRVTFPSGPPPLSADNGPSSTGKSDPVAPAKLDLVFVQAIMDPAAAGRFQPEYPPSLARAEVEGSATVRILIATDGHVKQVEMVSATDPAFFDVTRKQALLHWRFRPATRDGMPAESWRTMTVRFKLQG